ncbi:hypothetical protein TNCV_4309341 [Trichonephila clavipes]|nr:hypothetical protein TNCV_4309341 [Trichonephila clavipes]
MELRAHRRNPKQVRIIVMGDRCIGKSALIHALIGTKTVECIKLQFSSNYYMKMDFATRTVPLHIYDMTNTTECKELWRFYGRIRVNAVLLCYAAHNRKSFENIKTRWMPEARKYFNNAFIILVGLGLERMLEDTVVDPVFYKEGVEIRKKFHLKEFFAISTLRIDAVKTLFLITAGHVLM